MPTAVQNYVQAIGAYNDAARGKPMGDTKPADPLQQDDFAGLVRSAVKEAVRIGERSEQLSIAGINDRADINQVVTAVAEAEVTLQTVVSIRDKVIESYKQILRMPM